MLMCWSSHCPMMFWKCSANYVSHLNQTAHDPQVTLKRPSYDPYAKKVRLPTQALLVRLVKGNATSAIQIAWKEMMNTIKQSIDDNDPCDAAAEALDVSYDLFLDDLESSRKIQLIVNEISLATLQENALVGRLSSNPQAIITWLACLFDASVVPPF